MGNSKQKKVLFVCMGNICRSPTAEGVFRTLVDTQGLSDSIIVDSAGTHAYHIGNSPDDRAQATAKRCGVDLSDLLARKVKPQDFDEFDYIIGMDNDNLDNLKLVEDASSANSKASLHLLMEFAENWQNTEVPDPYYGGANGFDEVYKMVTDASQGLLTHILNDAKSESN